MAKNRPGHVLATTAVLLGAGTAMAQWTDTTMSSSGAATSTATVTATSATTPSSSGGTAPGPIVSGNAMCGPGYTYCGYILTQHQGFVESDIFKAYCNGHVDNCANGTTKTDPIQALYICLPPTSSEMSGADMDAGDNDDDDEDKNNDFDMMMGYEENNDDGKAHLHHRTDEQRGHRMHHSDAKHPVHGDDNNNNDNNIDLAAASPAPARGMDLLRGAFRSAAGYKAWSQQHQKQHQHQHQQHQHQHQHQHQQHQRRRRGSPGGRAGTSSTSAAAPAATGAGGQCSTASLTGNRIELLCTCQGAGTGKTGPCLNPDADHIGRCKSPP